MSFTLLVAVILDYWLGEPKNIHPLILFGSAANKIEATLRCQQHSIIKQRMMGLVALSIMVLPIFLVIYSIIKWNWLNMVLSPIILYFCIAAKSLKQHSENVYQALENDDLALAKKQVGMIVSRETEKMTADNIRKATIESVLENGADAVFAPIFWFVIAGPAGAVLYRLSNTLDAMWGYKNQRFIHFGWASARFDDLLNFIPARLTALSYALLGRTTQALKCWKSQAHFLDSPNAGPVMVSGAGALNLQLGGAAWYHGKLKNKVFFGAANQPINNDINRANNLITRSLYMWVAVLLIIELIGAIFA